MESMRDEFRNLHRSNLELVGNNVIKEIEECITRRYFTHISGKLYRFAHGSHTETFLKSCITEIRRIGSLIDKFDTSRMNVNAYRKFLCIFYPVQLFSNTTINTTAKSLFINPSKTIIIFKNQSFLEELMDAFSKDLTRIRRGGGGEGENELFETRIEDYIYKYDMESMAYDYTNINKEDMYEEGDHLWEYPPHILTQNTLFNLLTKRHPELSNDIICYMCEDINNILFNYFSYVGQSAYSEDFLSHIINMYESDKSDNLSLISYDDFEMLYSKYFETVMREDILHYFLQPRIESTNYDIGKHVQKVQPLIEVYAGGCRKTRRRRRTHN